MFCAFAAGGPLCAATIAITIDPAQDRVPISPYIYGTNQAVPGVTPTARRLGGNRMTGYNWENNASNAGSDWQQQSDDYMTSALGIPASEANVPAKTLTFFHDQSLAAGVPYTLLTLPMAGYVAADKNGPVSAAETAPSPRWAAVQNTKPGPFSATPDLTDGVVYTDELLHLLVQRYGSAATPTGIRGYDLDNEPDLWSSTHPRLHPAPTGAAELITRSVDLAKTVKRIDPAAETFGFVSYGFGGYYNFQNAPDWPTERTKGAYGWFIDYYLDQMAKASTAAGTRLLDVLDLHNYSEARGGGVRVTDDTTYTNLATNEARMQAPRAFWDPTYVEDSWIGQYYASYLPFLPRIKASIATFYPGTKLAFSEYNFGGEGDVSGGIAEADILGIFGRSGVYLAALWPLHSDLSYAAAAFNLYRNYDGAGGQFGDESVRTTDADTVNSSAYAAVDTAGRLHLMVLNKSYDTPTTFAFSVAGDATYASARVFAFDANSASITERAPVRNIAGNAFSYVLPARSAAHFVLSPDALPTPRIVNISSRAQVGTGSDVMIAGFVVGGSGTKKVLVRAVGPTLTQFDPVGLGPAVVLADPTLRLTTSTGATVAANDNWSDDPAIAAAAESAGAFALPAGSRDAALIATLAPGGYSAIVSGVNGTSGVALVEVYDLDPAGPARLINISTRAHVGTGAQALIAGFTMTGAGPGQVLVRAVGPTLSVFDPVNLAPGLVLPDPRLQLKTLAGSLLATDDNWDSSDAAAISAAGDAVGAFGLPPGGRDAALLATLSAGTYTPVVGDTTGAGGLALVEVYEVP